MGEISELRTLATVLTKDTIQHRKEKDQKNELESKNTDLGALYNVLKDRLQRLRKTLLIFKAH